MHFEHVGLIGWVHTLGCVVALITGAWNMIAFDRGRWHRLRGNAYVISMLVSNVLVFAIFNFDMDFINMKFGPGVLGFFHWLAIASLFFTLLGWYASTRQRFAVWAYTHPIAMALSYYVLAGGLANELFARIDALRPLAVTIVDGQQRFGSRITGMTQGAIMLATLLLIVLYVVRVAIRRHKRRNAVAARSAVA